MSRRRTKIFFDGGCRPNPGPIEVAVVVRGRAYVFDDLGHGTNGDAEWLALLRALELAGSLGLANAELIGDALEVTRQANAALASSLAPHRHAARLLELARQHPPGRIRWIRRAQNLAGIALAARHPR